MVPQVRLLELVAAFLHGIFPTQGLNLHLLLDRRILYHSATREAHGIWKVPTKGEGASSEVCDTCQGYEGFREGTACSGLEAVSRKFNERDII